MTNPTHRHPVRGLRIESLPILAAIAGWLLSGSGACASGADEATRAELAAMREANVQLARQLELLQARDQLGAVPVEDTVQGLTGATPEIIAARLQDYLSGRADEARGRTAALRPTASARRLHNTAWIQQRDGAPDWMTLQFGESAVFMATNAVPLRMFPADLSGTASLCRGIPMCVVWDAGAGPIAHHFVERNGFLRAVECIDYAEHGDGGEPPMDAQLLRTSGLVVEVRRGSVLCVRHADAVAFASTTVPSGSINLEESGGADTLAPPQSSAPSAP